MKLICIPYAGGSEVIYYSWRKRLEPEIKVIPVKLKGRGSRFCENFYETLEEAVDDIFEQIKDEIDGEEYGIFGHSMGGVLAYELYYKIVKEGYDIPKHMFFSGSRCPKFSNYKEDRYLLPDDEFIEVVIKLGGTPKEVIENKELLELCLPILRSDFKILETYTYKEKDEKLKCDVTVLNGTKDTIPKEGIYGWCEVTEGKGSVHNLEGGHFFLDDNIDFIMKLIRDNLLLGVGAV